MLMEMQPQHSQWHCNLGWEGRQTVDTVEDILPQSLEHLLGSQVAQRLVLVVDIDSRLDKQSDSVACLLLMGTLEAFQESVAWVP
jgi:hypothetical protein